MKRIILLSALLIGAHSGFSQDYHSQKIALVFHQVVIGSSIIDSAFYNTKLYDSHRVQGEDALDFKLSIYQNANDTAFEYLKPLLSALELSIHAQDHLKDKVSYSKYGYPNAAIIKMAARKAKEPYLLKHLVEIEYKPETFRKESGKLDLSSKNVKAFVRISLIIYDLQGKQLKKMTGEAFATEGLLTSKAIKIIKNDYGAMMADLSGFSDLYNKASQNLIQQNK